MSNVQAPPDLMTYQEAADALGITLGSLRTAVSERRLHSVKVPGIQHKFVRRAEIAEFRQHSRTTEAPQTPAPVARQLSPEETSAYVQAFAAPMENLAKSTAHAAAQGAMQEAVPGLVSMVLGGLQILRGQQPTVDPKALAV